MANTSPRSSATRFCIALSALVWGQNSSQQATKSGSGFSITAQGNILTNYHVVERCSDVAVGPQGSSESARIIAFDQQNDLALLALPHPVPVWLSFRENRLKLGETVLAAGYPLQGLVASSLNLTTGSVSALAGLHDDTRMVQFTAAVQPGSSSGALLDQSGTIVGVVTAKLSPLIAQFTGDIPQNVNFAVKASVVRDFLDSRGIEYRTAPPLPLTATPEVADKIAKAIFPVRCLSGVPGASIDSSDRKPITELRDVRKLFVGSLGNSEAAELVRAKLMNRLARAGLFEIVERTEEADAALTGIVGTNLYGVADTVVERLVNRDSRILWTDETSGRGFGSHSARAADRIASSLLKDVAKSRQP
jgi:Trypsin-like peptidase domain